MNVADIYINEKNDVSGVFSDLKIKEDKIKFPSDIKILAYTVKGDIKGFTPSIICNSDGDEILIPAHKKKSLTVNVLYRR